MSQKRTWQQRQRSVEECADVLRSFDERTLQRRAERLSIEVQITTFFGSMPNRTAQLIDEAGACFTNGLYTGCVLALASGVEYGLRSLLQKSPKVPLDGLISAAISAKYINEDQAQVLRSLKDHRNNTTHSNIDYLAAGRSLQRQMVMLTEQGSVENQVWEEFIPESQDEKEISADLAAEQKSGELLVKVRVVIHDIFDGQPPAIQTEDHSID